MAVWLLGQQRHPNDEGCSCTSNKAYSPNAGTKVEKKVSVAVCQWHCKNRSNRSQEKNSMFIKRRIDTRTKTVDATQSSSLRSLSLSSIRSWRKATSRVRPNLVKHWARMLQMNWYWSPRFKSEQGKREDTTFSITTPIAPAFSECAPMLMEQMEGSKVFCVILWEEEVSQRIQQEHHFPGLNRSSSYFQPSSNCDESGHPS